MSQGGGVAFRGRVRLWDEAAGSGLAVVDVPSDLVAALGGRRQYRVTGTIAGAPFTGSGMLVAGGGYCVGVSKGALTAAGVSVGEEVEVAIARV
jgi:NaMN:DMB phosphoribosyltransferase